MISNAPGQGYVFNVNAMGNTQGVSPYALLMRMAELDVELAKQATAVGMAVDLVFPDDLSTFTTVVPQMVAQKPVP